MEELVGAEGLFVAKQTLSYGGSCTFADNEKSDAYDERDIR
jgi:hypothetical protein